LAFVFTFCSIFSSTKLSKKHNLHKKNIKMPKNLKKQGKPLKIPKVILLTARFLSLISSKLTTLFAAKLFTTPIKHQIPKRELAMDVNSIQECVFIPTINKEVVVYRYGDSDKKILLVHGWSGRGTQLHKIADELLLNGFSTISFDAPAHGKSSGNSTIMIEFIATIMFLETKYGKFEGAIGHSLGGISLLNATRKGLKIDSLITIGSADIIKDIVDDFIFKLQLKPKFSDLLQKHFELKFGATMNSFSGFLSAKEIDIPVLIIHDHDDSEVSVKCAISIHKNLKNGQLMLTKGLGHRQILGNENVIEKVIDFLKQE
jgi:pimeloyl-ACP methyl ester carboxylesterase